MEGVELVREFDGVQALKGVTLGVEKGEALVLVGPNGAGKTTFMRLLAGRLKPSSGCVREGGRVVDTSDPGYLRRLGFVPQNPSFYGRLSCRENLSFFAALYGLRSSSLRSRVEEVLQMTGLSAQAEVPAGKLSGGMAQRLNVAMGLLNDPEYLLLDEPTAGLDPAARRDLLAFLLKMAEEGGKGILVTTHVLDEAEVLGGKVAVLVEGKLVGTFSPGLEGDRERWREIRQMWEEGR